MSKINIKAALITKTKLTAELENQIRSKATLHGSRVTGGATEDSDWDWIVPPGMKPSFDTLVVEGYAVYTSEDYNEDSDFLTLYVKTSSGEVWNLLYMHDMVSYRAWIRASRAVARLCEVDPFIKRALASCKENRSWLVETLRKLKIT